MTGAIIVAAGRGLRMGAGADKLWLPVAGRPLVTHTWERIDRAEGIDEVILVVRAEQRPAWIEWGARLPLRKPWRMADGGRERQDSVCNGLDALGPGCELVAIQDGARPCTRPELVSATIAAAREHGAAAAAARVADTLKEADERQMVVRTVDRTRLWGMQTPQTFRVPVIRRALEAVRAGGALVTDDAAACEWIGFPVRLVESRHPNPKATVPADLAWIEWLLAHESPAPE
ncbi:MAG: 2-C-methyl-D-erythritol 4-phosphate cytidylyltransferase [Verrucomicrobia bacterium]|nr:2-C-methyl-D-erythritol 4-phosphate cytidylyltransferase [Verrucomicrobiota bacterium]